MNPLQEQAQKYLELADLGLEILKTSRTELYLYMRFLDGAFAALSPQAVRGICPAGTDTACYYYDPESLAGLYRRGKTHINRLYLHSVLHCLFCHPFSRPGMIPELWNLACDMAVESIIDDLFLKCIYLPKSGFRREVYRKLRQEGGVVTAERIYRRLCQSRPDETMLARLTLEFIRDDHSRWPGDSGNPKIENRRKQWDDLRERMQTELESFAKESSDEIRSLTDQIRAENREKYDYREFLRKFCVLKEEMQVDLDTFDYIFYNYGMELYGNMPLIEPLETKETHKIEDFVIVLDTSMSCRDGLIRRFLEQTMVILEESESFCRRINLHIIQCDDRVQEDVLLTDRKEMSEYLQNFTARGLGGTDFRPPFEYVEQLKATGHFTKLRGLIYFTDGYGTFPVRKPDYDTAFVFLKDDYRDVDVPPWAIKLILDPDELENEVNYFEY